MQVCLGATYACHTVRHFSEGLDSPYVMSCKQISMRKSEAFQEVIKFSLLIRSG